MPEVKIQTPDSYVIEFGDYHDPATVKVADIHPAALAKCFSYGLVQYVRDGAATMTKDDDGKARPQKEIDQDKMVGVDKRLAVLKSGDIPAGGGGAKLPTDLKEARVIMVTPPNNMKELAKAKSWGEVEKALGEVGTTLLREQAQKNIAARKDTAPDLSKLMEEMKE